MGILVFVSYATKDADLFKVKDLAEELTRFDEIDDVLYWQEDMHDNIIKDMNDNLGKCDLMLLFCSKNALQYQPVNDEWMAAKASNKPIIPVFETVDHIPPLLRQFLGIAYNTSNLNRNIQAIYELVLKKLKIKKKKEHVQKEKFIITENKEKIITFRGAQIPQYEADVLQEIEKLTEKEFSKVNEINWWSTMRFFVDNQRVTGIGLFDCGLSTLPESIGDLSSLQTLNLRTNQLTTLPVSIAKLTSRIAAKLP